MRSLARRAAIGLLVIAGLIASSSFLFAQNPTVSGVKLEVMKFSAPTVVVSTITAPVLTANCNATPSSPNASTVNPTIVEFDDPDTTHVGKVCKIDIAAGINALAVDQFIGKAYFNYSDGSTGPASLPSNPFTRFILSAPTGLRFVR